MGHPRARTRGLFVERVDDGLVVYDDESKLAHSLTAEVCAVWELCDGMRTAERIAAASGLDGPLVGRAIGELTECGLLEGMGASHRLVSRREAARRLIGTGGAALSAPLIYSLVIGPATAAPRPGGPWVRRRRAHPAFATSPTPTSSPAYRPAA